MADFIEIARYSRKDEAEIVKGLLETGGIEAYVEDKGTQMIPETFGDLAVYKVVVKREDFEKAKAIIEEYEKNN